MRLRPTAKGVAHFTQADEEHNRHLQDLVDLLEETDSEELIRLLSLMYGFAKERWNRDEGKSKT